MGAGALPRPVARRPSGRIGGYDDRMSEPTPSPGSSDPGARSAPVIPGERRLAHPPSDRYRAAEERAAAAAADVPDPAASLPRGITLALIAAIVGAGAIVFVGGVIAWTTGLLAVAGLTGLGIAAGLAFGAGDHMAGRRRILLAIGLSFGAVALGQIGLWQYGRSEGGVLPFIDFLAQVYGPLVIAEFVAATTIAAVAAR